jgi:hypothetical protein
MDLVVEAGIQPEVVVAGGGSGAEPQNWGIGADNEIIIREW